MGFGSFIIYETTWGGMGVKRVVFSKLDVAWGVRC